MRSFAILTATALLALGGCSSNDVGSESRSSVEAPRVRSFSGDVKELREVLAGFNEPGADHAALTLKMRPSNLHYRRIFNGTDPQLVQDALDPHWDAGRVVIAPRSGQSEITIWSASTYDLSESTGNAVPFSPEWSSVVDRFKRDLVFYKVRFAEPGQSLGMTYEGLIKVRGEWVFLPKPWTAFPADEPATE